MASKPLRPSDKGPLKHGASAIATQLYTISYLILFAILGTLARLGLQAITFYPGAPVALGELWANFGGSLFMGFLSEDRRLFSDEWGDVRTLKSISNGGNDRKENVEDDGANAGNGDQEMNPEVTTTNAKRVHGTVKKTIPLYIGLATGFCGSFTSFSSFMRDVFLSLSNDLPTPSSYPSLPATNTTTTSRNGGESFMAVVAVILLIVCLCLSALFFGAHVANALDGVMPTIPHTFVQRYMDRLIVIIAWGSWVGAISMAIWPPDRPGGPAGHNYVSWKQETWRGQAIYAVVFAPVGCLLRFYSSIYLNNLLPSFPLGTFAVNILGTAVLGMAWDLQHAPLSSSMSVAGGSIVGCQVLQGVQDGFCGCLTTVSTWVSELSSLRRKHSYLYGFTSIAVALAFLVIIMGSLRWKHGFITKACV